MDCRYQVFISSTYLDLKKQRRLVAETIQDKGWFPSGMELFPSSDRGAWDHIKQSIQQSDLYFLIIAGCYGSYKPGEEKSYTELEYELAKEVADSKGLRFAVLIWDQESGHNYIERVDDDETKVKKQKAFIARLSQDMADGVTYFHDDATLIRKTLTSLEKFSRSAKPGWVRADQSPDHEELIQLSNELDKVNTELDEANETIDSLRKVAALPDEIVELGCDLHYTMPGKSPHKKRDQTAQITLAEIFTALGSELVGAARSLKSMRATLEKVAKGKFELVNNNWTLGTAVVHDADFNRIINHFEGIKWIRLFSRERSGTNVEITTLGRDMFEQIQIFGATQDNSSEQSEDSKRT